MPFDEEAVSAASNEEPTSRFERLKTVRWGRIALWAAVILTAWAAFSAGPGVLAMIPFLVAVWVITWLVSLWLRKDPDFSTKIPEPTPEPVAPKRLDKDVALTLDEELAFASLMSGLESETRGPKFDVIVYRDLLRMPWSKKPGSKA